MKKLREVAQQALKALEDGPDVDPIFAGETIHALKAALDVGPPEHERLAAFQAQADRDTRLLMRAHKEALRQRDYWQEEARRYAGNADFWKGKNEASTALPDLARQEQTVPVAWLESPHGQIKANPLHHQIRTPQSPTWRIPIYLHPPNQNWRGLTDAEKLLIVDDMLEGGSSLLDVARAIEAALKEKNNG